jgi:hypothetical protein
MVVLQRTIEYDGGWRAWKLPGGRPNYVRTAVEGWLVSRISCIIGSLIEPNTPF